MDVVDYLRFVLVLVLVLGAIFGLAWGLKRIGFAGTGRSPLGRRRRLSTIESTLLDGRHRVVLLRRDDVEHLVLIGPNTSQVIETGIPATSPKDSEGAENPSFLTAFSQAIAKDKQP